MGAVWCAAVVAAGIAFFLIKSRFEYEQFRELERMSGCAPGPGELTVVIPARNEEANIDRAVKSFPGVPVIVVNDDSEDQTAEVAEGAGARVIAAPKLVKGVMGKPNACQVGADACRSKWILFVDADTWYEPDFAGSLLKDAERHELVAASVFLRQERRTLFENLLLPYAFALYFCGVNAKRVNDPKRAEALANGQCLLVRRDAYEFIHGHRGVAQSVIEDVALASVMKRHRMKAEVLRGERLGSVRMYDGLGAIWRGFQKNSFRFLMVNGWTGVQVVLASMLLTAYAPVLAWLFLEDQWPVAVAFALIPAAALVPWYGSGWALGAPVAIYVFQLIALNGMATTLFGRKAIWKGRRV